MANDRDQGPADGGGGGYSDETLSGTLLHDAGIGPAAIGPAAAAPAAHAWIANDIDAPSGYGRVMFSRDAANALQILAGTLAADAPQITANTVIASGRAANDNAIWIGSDGDASLAGAYGRDASAAVLENGDAFIAWIGTDESVHGKYLPAADIIADTAPNGAQTKLDQMLARLGETITSNGGKAGRVVVTPTGSNSFAALWTSEFALYSVLMGTILTLGSDSVGAAESGLWTVEHIAPQTLPAGTSAFDVAVANDGALTVSYPQVNAEGHDAHVSVHLDRALYAAHAWAMTGTGEESAQTAHATPALSAANGHQGLDANSGSAILPASLSSDVLPVAGNETAPHTSTHASAAITSATNPDFYAVADNGHAFAGSFVPGADPAGPGKFIVTQLDTHGQPAGDPVTVTDNAIIIDSDHPTLDVAPTLTGTHDGFAAGWVEKTGDGPDTVKTLQVQAFDGDGQALSETPVTVATVTGTATSFSDISTGYTHQDGPGTSDDTSPPGTAPEASAEAVYAASHGGPPLSAPADTAPGGDGSTGVLAVAFIENANPDGFGTLKAQLYSVPDDAGPAEAPHGLVALGEDGHAGGSDHDAVFDLAASAPGDCRAPDIQGLDHGSLAVAWVEQTNNGAGPDVVRGVIMTPGENVAPDVIDLSPLMPEGVAAGTDPVLATDTAGDLIVGWIQSLLGGGYEADSAIYKHSGDHDWTPPSSTMSLGHFDTVPHDFNISVAGSGDSLALVVSWRGDDDTLNSVSYDIGSGQIGTQTVDPAHAAALDPSGSGIDLASADVGPVLVVHSEAVHNDGDSPAARIATVLLQTPAGGEDGQDTSSHSSHDADTGSSGAGHEQEAGQSAPQTDGTAEVPVTVTALTAAIVNFASDLIQFVTNSDNASGAEAPQLQFADVAGLIDAAAPTSQDVAALESFAAPAETSTAVTTGDTSGTGDGNGAGQDNGTHASDDRDAVAAADAAGASNGSDDGDGHRSGPDHSHDTASDTTSNGNAPAGFDDAPLMIATGYGNDISDYITPEDQAALIPEPVSILFEALQFANAFNDAANTEVLHFDTGNVVTISQFQVSASLDPDHNIPMV